MEDEIRTQKTIIEKNCTVRCKINWTQSWGGFTDMKAYVSKTKLKLWMLQGYEIISVTSNQLGFKL